MFSLKLTLIEGV